MNLLAQRLEFPGEPGKPTIIEGPLDPTTFGVPQVTIGSIISRAMPFLFGFAGLGLLLMIIAAGFTLLTSAGDAKKTEAGKQRLTYALVGFLVIFIAYWLAQIAGFIFGIPEFGDVFPMGK